MASSPVPECERPLLHHYLQQLVCGVWSAAGGPQTRPSFYCHPWACWRRGLTGRGGETLQPPDPADSSVGVGGRAPPPAAAAAQHVRRNSMRCPQLQHRGRRAGGAAKGGCFQVNTTHGVWACRAAGGARCEAGSSPAAAGGAEGGIHIGQAAAMCVLPPDRHLRIREWRRCVAPCVGARPCPAALALRGGKGDQHSCKAGGLLGAAAVGACPDPHWPARARHGCLYEAQAQPRAAANRVPPCSRGRCHHLTGGATH